MSAQNLETNSAKHISTSRRLVVKGAMAALASQIVRPTNAWADASAIVNDVTLLNPVRVNRIVAPRSTEEIRLLIGAWRGPISIGGGRYSMGGQIAAKNSLHLDMREFNKIVQLDLRQRTVRVQTGMRWRDLQTIIDPHDLSVKIMQSYANFTIGGALSVNAHGRYVALGPIINSVRRIQVILAGGTVVEATPADNADLFYGAIGGYGGLGVITEVELDLVPNVKMARWADRVPIMQYPSYFNSHILNDPDAILHNADIDPSEFETATAVTWRKTDKPVTVTERLFPMGSPYFLEKGEVWALAELPGAHLLRRTLVDPVEYARQPVVWRNHEASMDVASLGPIASSDSIYALQEYFIPVAAFDDFAQSMVRILHGSNVNALNVSVRYSPVDPGAMLAWARESVFSFVLYYRQHTSLRAQDEVGDWTRKLIAAALSLGGSYYLPYQLHATQTQFEGAYPAATRFFALKAKVDPLNQFRNKLWDKYYT